jgi:glucose/arabinose dehydrogenase
VIGGMDLPTAVRFARDGRVFVTLKGGKILLFDSLADRTPSVFADLSSEVYNNRDHGLLGLALDPRFPTRPYVYVLYSYDGPMGSRVLHPGRRADICPSLLRNGCVTSGRLSVLTARGDRMTGPERVLLWDWCNQYDTHSVGDLGFGPDGSLYASGGDGAGWTFADYGQRGAPPNPCGDPPGKVGTALTFPTAEGGALRAQDLQTPADPVTLDGTVVRVDPRTGQGWPGNPLSGSRDRNARRVVAYGLKQPFRFTLRPGTSELWVGDVGAHDWEEINRVASPRAPVEDFGWPCYEGPDQQDNYEGATQIATFDLCKNLYAQEPGAVTAPFYAYNHRDSIVPGDRCPVGSNAISALAFGTGTSYPGGLGRSFFFADGERSCIWRMPLGPGDVPDPSHIELVANRTGVVVDLEVGPGRRLYGVDISGGRVFRLDPG